MKRLVFFFAVLALVIAFTSAPVAAQDAQPVIQDFKFIPQTVRYGDTLRYTFAYKNLPGGLAAVKDVEMWVLWLTPNSSYVRSRYVPISEELAKYTAESGTFESRDLTWRPPQKEPPGGSVDVEYTLQFRLQEGRKVKAKTTLAFTAN